MTHPRKVSREHVILGEIYPYVRGPAEHGEQIRIRHGERIAHQIVLGSEIRGQPLEFFIEIGQNRRLPIGRNARIEEGAEALVQFRGDVVEELYQLIALEAAGARRQP